jgi:sensor histidine kinase YesM
LRAHLALPPTPRPGADALRTLPLVFLVSSLIAVLLNLHDPADSLSVTLKVANATGLIIWGVVFLIRTLSKDRIGRLPAMLIAAPIATLLGYEVASLLGTVNPVVRWINDPWHQWRPILLSLLLTLVALAFFLQHFRATEYRTALETHRRQVAEARQSETLARLALLQAQIEPHFLFNTLANVQSMIQRDPQTASQMLDHLNRYLRGSLSRTRNPTSTCGDEIELIEALLAIAAIRLGARLRYRIRLPDDLRNVQLPPLLLQPLVENALKHGIEPAVEG